MFKRQCVRRVKLFFSWAVIWSGLVGSVVALVFLSRWLWQWLLILLMAGCAIPERGLEGSRPVCTECFPYAGTYYSTLEGSSGDETWVNEMVEIVVQQNGPAIMVSNILALGDTEGLSFGHKYMAHDPWINGPVGEPMEVTYSGASRPTEPYTLDLKIEVEYPYLEEDWGYTLDYVVTLGDSVVFE